MFTDPTKGEYITFDLYGNGQPIKVSWPKVGSGNAWLALDRDGDGVIKDGTELFGNFSPHADGGVPNRDYRDLNGFLALAWYDQRAQGGNVDLVIDKDDAIWPKLRLWIDTHCQMNRDKPCQSLPTELHTLDSLGIHSISLVYHIDRKVDAIGNSFKFASVVNPDVEDTPRNKYGLKADKNGNSCCVLHQTSKDGRAIYDVILKAVE